MSRNSSFAGRCDVVVLGSGVAGMTCALAAARGGARVVLLEKSALIGGTSAMSGAGIWAPANHLAAAEGIEDSPEIALDYMRNALGNALCCLPAAIEGRGGHNDNTLASGLFYGRRLYPCGTEFCNV